MIGTIQMDLGDWRTRQPASQIIDDLRRLTANIPVPGIQIQEQQQGPGSARPVQVDLASSDAPALQTAADRVIDVMEGIGGFVETSSDVPVPGVEARIVIDREQAACAGVDVATLGGGQDADHRRHIPSPAY